MYLLEKPGKAVKAGSLPGTMGKDGKSYGSEFIWVQDYQFNGWHTSNRHNIKNAVFCAYADSDGGIHRS